MAQTSPPPITPSPAAPDRADRNTFSSRATTWADWLKNNAVSEIAAVATNVYANAVDAYGSSVASAASAAASQNSAQASAASASAAASVAGAAPWVNGGTYAQNACVVSLVTFQTYRKKTASSVTTIEPSIDSVNWAVLGSSPSVAAIELTYSQYGAV